MIGSGIKKFGTANNLRIIKNNMVGVYKGYYINLDEGMGYKRIIIAAYLKDSGELVQQLRNDVFQMAKMYFQNLIYDDYYIEFDFKDTFGLNKKYYEVLDYVLDKLNENNVLGNGYCTYCGEKLDENNYSMAEMTPVIMPVHNDCINKFNEKVGKVRSMIKQNDDDNNRTYIKGIFGALLGGVVCTIPWIIIYLLGYVASLGALLVGIGAAFGYKKLGGRSGNLEMPLIMFTTVIALFIGFFFSYCAEIYFFSEIPGITISETPYIFIEAMKTIPEYSSAIIKNTLMSLLFSAIGMIAFFSYLKKRTVNVRSASRL